MEYRKKLSVGIIVGVASLMGVAVRADDRMDLDVVRRDVLAYLGTLKIPGGSIGEYRKQPDGESDFYATCDVVIIRTVMGEDLQKSLSVEEREDWTKHINSFAKEDGSYPYHKLSLQHWNGMAVSALSALGGRQRYPVQFYDEFNTTDKVIPWLERIDWEWQWSGSHLFWGGIHCFSMSSSCSDPWRSVVFDWLDHALDPETGWWRKGIPLGDEKQGLGGGAHIWPIYQHHGRTFPYPERVIDRILELQKPDGSWLRFGTYLDLDALYGLAYMRSLVPEYRKEEITSAVNRHGDLAMLQYQAYMESKPDTHLLLAMVGDFGLLNQLLPARFYDTVQWTDIFSDIRLYRTDRVEWIGKNQ